MNQVVREYKVVKTIKKNLIWSFTYLILVATFIVCFLMLWTKIINPSLKEIKNTSEGIETLNSTFGDIKNVNISTIQNSLKNFFKDTENVDINNLANQIKGILEEYNGSINSNPNDIINSTVGLIKNIKEVINIEGLNQTGNDFLNSITKVGDSINNINKISQSWFNINFSPVLYDLMNNKKTVKEIINSELPNLLKSKAIIFLIILGVVCLIIVPLLIKMVLSSIFFILKNGRLEKTTRQSFFLLIFNVIFSPIPLLNTISWSFIYMRFKKKKQKIKFKE